MIFINLSGQPGPVTIGEADRGGDGEPGREPGARDPVDETDERRSRRRAARAQAGGRRVRAVDSRGVAREGAEPRCAEAGVGRRGQGARGGRRHAVLQIWRVPGEPRPKARAISASRRWTASGGSSIPTGTSSCRSARTRSALRPRRRPRGREPLFAALPPSQGGRGASFYAWNLQRRYGTDWAAQWVDTTIRRMIAWGFNTIGNWSDPRLGAARRIPYVFTTRGWGIENGPDGRGRRVRAGLRPKGRSGCRAAVRAAQGRSIPARLFHRQRAALAGPGIGGGGRDPGRQGESAAEARSRRISRRATRRSAARPFCSRRT